jgi:hypothetical protein
MTQPSPTGSGFADRVLAALGPAFRTAAGPLLPDLLTALTAQLGAVDELLTVGDGDLAAAPLTDLATSPFPRWLGQLAGLRVPAGLDVAAARAHVTGRGVSRRGTPAAMRAAAAATLTGGRRVTLVERNGSPWQLLVLTYARETPDPAAVLAAVLQEKPVGIVLTHAVLLGQTFGQLTATGQTFGDLRRSGLTFDQIRRTIPDD